MSIDSLAGKVHKNWDKRKLPATARRLGFAQICRKGGGWESCFGPEEEDSSSTVFPSLNSLALTLEACSCSGGTSILARRSVALAPHTQQTLLEEKNTFVRNRESPVQ